MKKILLGLCLVIAMTVPAFAGGSFTLAEGEGSLVIVTLQQKPEFPLNYGEQLAVEWFNYRGGQAVGLRWHRHEGAKGTLSFCGEPKKVADGGFEMLCMEFESAGLVARYNYNKKTEAFVNAQIVFNGIGKFFIVDCDENGEEKVDSSFIECGEAGIQGSLAINKNGVGILQGTTVQGGNIGFLWRGNLSGKLIFCEDDTVE